MADFSSSAFGGTGPDPAISPSIGGIAKNLTSTLFGNPDDYARNQYYGAETRNKDQETTNLQDAATAAKGLAATFSDPSFFSKPPPGVDPGQWVAQHLSSAASNAFLSAYAKDPAAAMGNVNKLAGMVNIMTGNQAQGLTGLALEGHAPDENTALTPDAQAQIYGRKAKTELNRAGIAANAEVTSREYVADQDTASKKYAVDNPHFVLPAGSTGIVGSNATNLYNDQNKGVFQGQPSESSAKGAAFSALTPAQQAATFFQPHNVEPGAATIIPSGSPYADPNATTVIPAPKTATAKIPPLTGANAEKVSANVARDIDPDGDNFQLDQYAGAGLSQMLSVLPPQAQDEYAQVVSKAFQDGGGDANAAAAKGAAFLRNYVQVNRGITSIGTNVYTPKTPSALQNAVTPPVTGGDVVTGPLPPKNQLVVGKSYAAAGGLVWDGNNFVPPRGAK